VKLYDAEIRAPLRTLLSALRNTRLKIAALPRKIFEKIVQSSLIKMLVSITLVARLPLRNIRSNVFTLRKLRKIQETVVSLSGVCYRYISKNMSQTFTRARARCMYSYEHNFDIYIYIYIYIYNRK